MQIFFIMYYIICIMSKVNNKKTFFGFRLNKPKMYLLHVHVLNLYNQIGKQARVFILIF